MGLYHIVTKLVVYFMYWFMYQDAYIMITQPYWEPDSLVWGGTTQNPLVTPSSTIIDHGYKEVHHKIYQVQFSQTTLIL